MMIYFEIVFFFPKTSVFWAHRRALAFSGGPRSSFMRKKKYFLMILLGLIILLFWVLDVCFCFLLFFFFFWHSFSRYLCSLGCQPGWPQTQRIHLPLPPSTGIKDVHHPAQLDYCFLNVKSTEVCQKCNAGLSKKSIFRCVHMHTAIYVKPL